MFFKKKSGFGVFLVHPTVVLVLLFTSAERCFVSRIWYLYFVFLNQATVHSGRVSKETQNTGISFFFFYFLFSIGASIGTRQMMQCRP